MNEMHWKNWLKEHPGEVLETIGLSREDQVLDFGCGRQGYYTLSAAGLAPRGHVYALDRDIDCLGTVARRAKDAGLGNIEIIHSEDLTTGLPDDSIDVVLLFDVIHAIRDWDALLAEMRRVVKPGGLVSVHPMHVCNDEVRASMCEAGFRFVSDYYDGHLLVFRPIW